MKSKILIAGAILCAISAAPAHAVTKCVALNSNTTCSAAYATNGTTDWTGTCAGTPVSGVGVCSNTKGTTIGTAQTSITTALGTGSNNIHCWCKMTSPAVSSRWIYGGSSDLSSDHCGYICAANCATYLQSQSAFRRAMFSSLSD